MKPNIPSLAMNLTPRQQEVVNYSGEQMLVRGIAGSGKTTVLLRRAYKLVEQEDSTTIALFTYNRTLARFAREIADAIGTDRIVVNTFHGWAAGVLRTMKITRFTVYGEKQRDIIKRALAVLRNRTNHRYFKSDDYIDFLINEVSWMKGKKLLSANLYLKADRSGRGNQVRVTDDDRRQMWAFFEEYQGLLKRSKWMDYDDYALAILENIQRIPESLRIDHVMVDEAQDLQLAQLEVLRLAARRSLVVAADKGQKIYNTSFSWKDVGINVSGGRTKVLQNTYRSTRQIIELAHSLQKHDPICMSKDEDYIEPVYPDVDGPMPKVVACTTALESRHMLVKIVKALASDQGSTIGILARQRQHVYRYKRVLEEFGMACEVIQQNEGNAHSPGVKLTTFHSAKGLEFDVVVIPNVEEGVVPPERANEQDGELEIERRLLYVAMTRARHDLYLLYSGSASRFLEEMDSRLYRGITP